MSESSKSVRQESFIIGRARFGKISAIEGIMLDSQAHKIVDAIRAEPSSRNRRKLLAAELGLKDTD